MEFEDLTGYKITLNGHPKRIISLVPSQTELLYHFGIEPIAQTIFCVHPKENFKKSIKIGGTKKLNIDKIKQLKPDLIIGNKEENQKEQIEELRKYFPVWLSDIYSITHSNHMILEIGKMTDSKDKAVLLSNQISDGFKDLNIQNNIAKTVLYLIWRNPFMAAGRNTFINDILIKAGYENALINKDSRYPELTPAEIVELKPSEILLSSEPYPFKEEHIQELQTLLPKVKIKLVDGELFSWHGPRLLETVNYLKSMKSSL